MDTAALSSLPSSSRAQVRHVVEHQRRPLVVGLPQGGHGGRDARERLQPAEQVLEGGIQGRVRGDQHQARGRAVHQAAHLGGGGGLHAPPGDPVEVLLPPLEHPAREGMEDVVVQLGPVLDAESAVAHMTELDPGVDADQVRELDGDRHVLADLQLAFPEVPGAEDPRPSGADVHQGACEEVELGRAEGDQDPTHPVHPVGAPVVLLLQDRRQGDPQGAAAVDHAEALELGGGLQEAHAMGKPDLEVLAAQPEDGIFPAHGRRHVQVTALDTEKGRLEAQVGRHEDQQLPALTGAQEDLRDDLRVPNQIACQCASRRVPASIMLRSP